MELLPTVSRPVWLVRDLHRLGVDETELRSLRRSGQVRHVRRGAYAADPPDGPAAAHRLLLSATLPLLSSDACTSHTSAGLLHGLPWWATVPDRVHVTRSRSGGGRRNGLVHVHPGLLEADERTVIDGLPVTSLARTVADCLRWLPFRQGVAVADAGLRLGLDRAELDDQVRRAAGRAGAATARRASAFADGRAESVGESFSRVVIHELGLPEPDLQVEVRDDAGVLVGRCDFGWRRHRTLGEFDGKIKYGRLLRDGQEPGDVVFDEKVREDALRDLDNEVVRWIDADLRAPDRLRSRIVRALVRGSQR